MHITEVIGTQDLINYIKLELARQTVKRKTVDLDLPEKLFFKLIKLILFYIKNDKNEYYKDYVIEESLNKFYITINNVKAQVTKR